MNVVLMLTPAGHLRLIEHSDGWALTDDFARTLMAAFTQGNGFLNLLTDDFPAGMPADWQFFRQFASAFITRVCHARADLAGNVDCSWDKVRPDPAFFADFAEECPPFSGREYLTAALLTSWWAQLEHEVQSQIQNLDHDWDDWLQRFNPAWQQVGRVSFHLAENKQDASGEHPFAFLATFIHRLSASAQPKHLPLASALKAYANDRNALMAVLKPIQAAGEKSDFIAGLVAGKDIYRPLAWSAQDAGRFLRDIPLLESCGIVVRMTNLWKNSSPGKVKVDVQVDLKPGQKLGINALLDFSLRTSLNGVALTKEELEQLYQLEGGLVRLKGDWVVVEPEKIRALLAQWEEARIVAAQGFPFIKGLRMLAGLWVPGQRMGEAAEDIREYCRIEAGEELRKQLEELESPEKILLPDLPPRLAATLRPYQLNGVKWLWRMGELGLGACLADDMGLGKTIQVLSWLTLLRQKGMTKSSPALLVVPASLLVNWRQEAAKFTPELSLKIIHPMFLRDEELVTPDRLINGVDVVVTTYGMLLRQAHLREREWSAVIADEAQAIKNPESQQSRVVRGLLSSRRLALTGTPVENKLTDLWSLFDYINPGLLGSASDFRAWTEQMAGADGKINYTPVRKLTRPYIMRRLKTDKKIISDLPDKVETKVYCRLTPAQAVLYQQTVRAMARDLKAFDDIQRKGVVLKYLMMFKQICNHPAQFDGSGDYRPAQGGKFANLTALTEKLASRQEKMLVFTQFKEMTEPLNDHLVRCWGRTGEVIHGGTPVARRQEIVTRFQQDELLPFLVLSLKAAGTGLNLTAANHVIHFDRWWNPAVENQATDRAFRIGQHRNVMVHKFICRGTIEEKIDGLIESKKELADALLGGGTEKLLTEMSNEELLNFVALDVDSLR